MLETVNVTCPYCGGRFDAVIDCSVEEQTYYEDCQVCCASIEFDIRCDIEGNLLNLECRSDRE